MFRSVDEALRFAFTITARPIVSVTKFSAEQVAHSDDRLDVHDRHAQGAWIIRYVQDHLPQRDQLYIVAQYGSGPGRDTALALIADMVHPSGKNRRLTDALVRRHFGGGTANSQAAISKRLHIPQQTVSYAEKKLRGKLAPMWTAIEGQLFDTMQRRGLLDG